MERLVVCIVLALVVSACHHGSRFIGAQEIRDIRQTANTQRLQELLCLAMYEPHDGRHGVNVMANIGGWFGVQSLQAFLRPTRFDAFGHSPNRKGDYFYRAPGESALLALYQLFPDGPRVNSETITFSDKTRRTPMITAWNSYITARESKLRMLEPTGEGVDFSDAACSKGKPTKQPMQRAQ